MYRELLWLWIVREIRSRYKQSVLGGLWAILQPVTLMIVFTVIFSNFLHVSTDAVPYPIFSYSGLLFWTFFSTSITFGANSLVNNISLLTKVYFPREILLMAAVGASLFDLLIASTVFGVMMVHYHIPIHGTVLWVLPLMLLQMVLAYGIILIASAINVFYRDVRFIVPLGMQLWMYVTPVIYPVVFIPERWRAWLAVNPMLGIIGGYRRVILEGNPPNWSALWPAIVITAMVLIVGHRYFKAVEWSFADAI